MAEKNRLSIFGVEPVERNDAGMIDRGHATSGAQSSGAFDISRLDHERWVAGVWARSFNRKPEDILVGEAMPTVGELMLGFPPYRGNIKLDLVVTIAVVRDAYALHVESTQRMPVDLIGAWERAVSAVTSMAEVVSRCGAIKPHEIEIAGMRVDCLPAKLRSICMDLFVRSQIFMLRVMGSAETASNIPRSESDGEVLHSILMRSFEALRETSFVENEIQAGFDRLKAALKSPLDQASRYKTEVHDRDGLDKDIDEIIKSRSSKVLDDARKRGSRVAVEGAPNRSVVDPPTTSEAPQTPACTAQSYVIINAAVSDVSHITYDRLQPRIKGLIGTPIAVVTATHDPQMMLSTVRQSLVDEFPYAESAIDRVLALISWSPSIQFKPIVLMGPPGAGKNRLAGKIAKALGFDKPSTYSVPRDIVGVIGGTTARYDTGAVSYPLSEIARQKIANPFIILDEFGRVEPSYRANGLITDVLLEMFDRETARTFMDPLLCVQTDLSKVNWMGTTNDITLIPPALRSRINVIEVAAPRREDCARLVETMASELSDEVAPARDGISASELAIIKHAWKDQSLRTLEAMVRAVFTSRDHPSFDQQISFERVLH